ncbi:MAG: MFS transporter [Chitinophagaceae bacterium]
MIQANKRQQIKAWTFYDWANSAYSLIITSAIFPAYYTQIVDEVEIFGHQFQKSVVASFSISFSFLLIAFLSPILSSIADYQGNKKGFMKFFCYLGALSCMGMFFFVKKADGANVFYGLACSILASIGYCGSIVFYNAFLPEIADKNEQDTVSAKGFAMGYIGSVILMIVCLALMFLNASYAWFETDLHIPERVSFLLVGVWWIGFAQIPFRVLKEEARHRNDYDGHILMKGFQELKKVWHELKSLPVLRLYLAAFFFFNMGVQTVMYMATYFAGDELKMEPVQLLLVVLIIQLVAIAGARLFAKISDQKGNLFSLSLLVIIWIGICISAYVVNSVNQFYVLAFAVGMVMGGIQSLSRSTYSKFLPDTPDTASYFSFYDVCEKLGIVIGTASFGLIADGLGSMRLSALALSVYFAIGLLILFLMRKRHTQVLHH